MHSLCLFSSCPFPFPSHRRISNTFYVVVLVSKSYVHIIIFLDNAFSLSISNWQSPFGAVDGFGI
jgi:hypothetical protein